MLAASKKSFLHIAGAIAVLAWCLFLGQALTHASEAEHAADVPQSHCLLCSAGALDDGIALSPSAGTFPLPVSSYSFIIDGNPHLRVSAAYQRFLARAPPASLTVHTA